MFSYGVNNEFVVAPNVTQLVGKNGDGKSSIATILEELLYNKNSRGIKKANILNRYCDSKEYSGYVHFKIGEDSYTLNKVVTTTAKVKLEKNGLDISGHTTTQTYKLVEELLGMDFGTFTKLVYQSMVSSLDFLSATDANRKKFLVSLLGLEKYVEAEKTFKEAGKEAKISMAEIQGSVGAINTWIDTNTEIPEILEELEVPEISNKASVELAGLSYELVNVVENNKAISENIRRLLAHDSIVKISKVAKPRERNSDLGDAREDLAASSAVRKAKFAEVKKISAIKEECHVCGSKLEIGNKVDMLHVASTEFDSAKSKELVHDKRVVELEKLAKELRCEEIAYSKYTNYLLEISNAEALLDSSKPTELIDELILKDKISKLEIEINLAQKEVSRVLAINAEIAANNSTVGFRTEQLNSFKEKLLEEKDNLDEVSVLTARLGLLARALGAKGLIAYKVESMVKVFENLINEYLHVLAEGRFALSFVVEDAKLVLNTYSNGSLVDIKSLSSGEFNRVNTATLLAVRKVMSSISKMDINLLILDEVVSVLDQQGKDTLIDVLLKEHNLSSVVVSHGYEHPLASKVTVIKENNISRLE